MPTRRSSKAAAAAPSSPSARPSVRRNPPRATRRQVEQDVSGDPSSDLSPAPSSSSAILQMGSLPPSRPPGVRPLPSPVAPSASIPPPQSSPTLRGMELPKGLTSVPRKGSLVYDPKPRRGAPRRASLSSINIVGRDNSEDETTIQEPESEAERLEKEMIQRDIKEAEDLLKVEAIDSLARDARNVIGQFQNKSRPSYHEVLAMKMQAFKATRGLFLAQGQVFPFLQYDWLRETSLKMSESTRATAALAIKLANIATALAYIEKIESRAENPKFFLDAIDTSFPRYFAAEEDKQNLSLSLEIRTQRAIERIASAADGIDKRTELSWVFCPTESRTPGKAPKGGYPELFRNGPYRALAGLDSEPLVDVCSERVLRIWEKMSDGHTRAIRDPVNLDSIRKEFPLKNMLDHLKKWLMARFQGISHSMAKVKQEEAAKEEKRLLEQLREEEEERRQTFEEERQPFEEERRAKAQQLRYLEDALRRQKRQQQDQEQERKRREREGREAKTQKEVPRALPGRFPSPNADEGSWAYQQGAREESPESIDSTDFEPTPQRTSKSSRSLFRTRDVVGMLNAPSPQEQSTSEPSRKRSNQRDPNEAEADDDDFEVLSRPQKKGKTAASSTIVYRPPEQRRSGGGTRPQDDNESPSLGDDDEPAAAPSSAPDYAAMQHAKKMNSLSARLDKPRPHQQRHPWSEKDCNTLIKLIEQRAASWGDIQKYDNHKFEHSRNQQAYRDKARNLKVDFLISDAPLPPMFDLVALGSKEVDKVTNAGRNPYRRECDVDSRGRPTRTRYNP